MSKHEQRPRTASATGSHAIRPPSGSGRGRQPIAMRERARVFRDGLAAACAAGKAGAAFTALRTAAPRSVYSAFDGLAGALRSRRPVSPSEGRARYPCPGNL